MENSASFCGYLGELMSTLKARYPNHIVVIVADSPNAHRKYTEGKNPRGSQMSKAELKPHLEEMGVWRKSLTKAEAIDLFTGSEAEYRWLMDTIADAEKVAFAKGAILLWNGNTCPQFNSIERYWRAANQAFKEINQGTMAWLRSCWKTLVDGEQHAADFERRHYFSQQLRRFTFRHPEAPIAKEDHVLYVSWEFQAPLETDELRHLLCLGNEDGDIDFQCLFAYVHYLNSTRNNGPVRNFSGMELDKAPAFDFDAMWTCRWKEMFEKSKHDVWKRARATENDESGSDNDGSNNGGGNGDDIFDEAIQSGEPDRKRSTRQVTFAEVNDESSAQERFDGISVPPRKKAKPAKTTGASVTGKSDVVRGVRTSAGKKTHSINKRSRGKRGNSTLNIDNDECIKSGAAKKVKAPKMVKPLVKPASIDSRGEQQGNLRAIVSTEPRDQQGRVSYNDRYQRESCADRLSTHLTFELRQDQWNSLLGSGAWVSSDMVERWMLVCNAWLEEYEPRSQYYWFPLEISAQMFERTSWDRLTVENMAKMAASIGKSKLLMPFCDDVHYWLFVLDLDAKLVTMYDSNSGDAQWPSKFGTEKLAKFLQILRPGQAFSFKCCLSKDQPRQVKGNCGVFTIETGRALIMGLEPKRFVLEKNMDSHREHIAEEIRCVNLLSINFR